VAYSLGSPASPASAFERKRLDAAWPVRLIARRSRKNNDEQR